MGGERVATDLADIDDMAIGAARPQIPLAVAGHPVAAFLPDGRRRLVAHALLPESLTGTEGELVSKMHTMAAMSDLLNGIPRVDPTAAPPWTLRVVARILSTDIGSVVHRRAMAPL